MALKMSTRDFIIKARNVHGNRYDYSKVNYVNSVTKVEITCKIHGGFWQSPNKHLIPRNCPKCAKVTQRRKKTLTKEQVLKKFREVHGDKYDYPEFHYKKMRSSIDIICPIHGLFKQEVFAHSQGKGCRKCGIDKISDERRVYDTASFISHCRKIHYDKYDYSKVGEYKSSNTKITICCPIHGDFEQLCQSHYKGHGCPECGIIDRWYVGGFGNKVEYYEDQKISDEPCYVYLVGLNVQGDTFYKIGITTEVNPRKRFISIKHGAKASELKPLFTCLTTLTKAYSTEQYIKRTFYDYRHKPTTRFDGWTECISNINPEEVIIKIKENLNE